MNIDQLRSKVRNWDQIHSGNPVARAKYGQILDQIEYHARREWRRYIPAEHTDFNSNYMDRLASWIGNALSDVDQQLLLEYALMISFFSHEDFTALYRTAMEREITRWVASQTKARLQSQPHHQFSDHLRDEVNNRTWFCPITDSMDINEFYKINHLKGVGHRPAFSSLQLQAEDPVNPNSQIALFWHRYMSNPGQDQKMIRPSLKRIVLLEDIVGSASQCENAISWAVRSFGFPVLFVPLILCPNGVERLRDLEKKFSGKLTVCPVVEVQRGDLLGPERRGEAGWDISVALEDLIDRYHAFIDPDIDPYGYRNTGCSISTFANTPDNTIPIVHHTTEHGRWAPLFPRVYRN
jgi:hypothetical protein